MSETKPTGEQIRFRSANTGDHVLDTYLESAEIGGRTLTDLLDDLFDPSNNGVFRSDNFEFRFDSNKIQFRVGQFASSTAGFTDVTTFFAIKGTFSTSTAYNNFDVVTTSDKDVYIVHGLSTATTYSSESNFISSANTTKIVDVSEAKDWAIKTDGIVSSTGYSAKAWAIGGTGVDNASSGGAAKDWATKTGGTVDGSDFSAKHYATTGNVAAVAGALSNINTVAGNTTNINTVAGVSSNVTTVAGISSDVTAVAGANSNISALNASGVITNIGTVAGGISNVNTLAAISTDLTSLANSLEKTYVVTVANVGGSNVFVLDGSNYPAIEMFRGNTYIFNLNDATNDGHPLVFKNGSSAYETGVTYFLNGSSVTQSNFINTTTFNAGRSSGDRKVQIEVATNAPSSGLRYYCYVHGNGMGNVITVKDSNVSLVAGSITSVNSVASNIANVNTVSGITSNLATVAGISSAVSTVSASNSNVTAVSGAITNINTVAGGLTNVNTVATNISSVNNFADVYRIASSAPTSSLNSGDLYFDTSTNTLKVYGASGWQNAGSSVNGTSDRFHYDITGTPNSVTGSDANGNTLAYDAGFIDVYVNGVRMSPQDITISSGDTVTFANALTAGDEVDIVAFGTFSVSNLNASNLTSGTVPIARLGSGTKNNTTFLRGDNTFQVIDLTALSASNLTSGTIPDARFPATLPAISGANLTNLPVDLTALSATNLTSGTIASARVSGSYTGITSVGTLTALTVDDITINGSTISDGGDFTLDVASDITLDAGGGNVALKDDGTAYMTFTNINGSNTSLTSNLGGDLTIDVAGVINLNADGGEVYFDDGSTSKAKIRVADSDLQIRSLVSDKDITFEGNDGGSIIEAMRIDMSEGGRVGIGLAPDPSVKLSINGGIGTTNGGAGGPTHTFYSDPDTGMFRAGANVLGFACGGSERMRIDSSGRLGLGISAPDAKLHVISGDADTQIKIQSAVSANATTSLLMMSRRGGAENQNVTIKATSGNLSIIGDSGYGKVGIGTSSPNGKLHVLNSNASITASVDADDLIVENNGACGITIGSATNSTGSIRFADSAGTQGMVYYTHITNDMRFYTVASERMRIASSGYVGINTSYPNSQLTISSAAGSVYNLNLNSSTTVGTKYHIQFTRGNLGTGATQAGYLISNQNQTVSLVNTSDERLKENIVDSGSATQSIKDLKVRKFNWKNDASKTIDFGFVAQEMLGSVPEAVVQGGDETDENGNYKFTWGVGYADLVPRLVKTIQELEARITALESA